MNENIYFSIHDKLKDSLLEKIKNSEVNAKLPSENTLAKEMEVSRSTVNKVMVELERDGYVRRLQGKGTYVSPRDSTIHTGVGSVGKGTIVLAYPDYFAYSIWSFVHRAEIIAMRQNYRLINFKMQKEANFKAFFELFRSNDDLKGIIILPPSNGLTKSVIKELDSMNVPCVLKFPFEEVSLYKNIYTVETDHFKSGYLKMQNLLENGHRKIGFVANEPNYNPLVMRGMYSAMKEYGLKQNQLIVSNIIPKPWGDGIDAGYEQTLELMKNHKLTALVCDTFPGAFGALRGLHKLGLSCPDDISITTAVDMGNFTKMCSPALNTVNSDTDTLIEKAFDIINNPQNQDNKFIVQDVFLCKRESVKKIKKSGEKK